VGHYLNDHPWASFLINGEKGLKAMEKMVDQVNRVMMTDSDDDDDV